MRQLNKIIQHHLMHLGVTDNALLAHIFLTGLKLRLNEAQNLALLGFQQIFDGGQDDLQPNEAHIDHRKIQRLSQILRGHIADIGALHHHHSGIRADLPVQLAVANINGKDLAGTLLEQAIGKATGGGSGITANIALRLHAKITKCFLQL